MKKWNKKRSIIIFMIVYSLIASVIYGENPKQDLKTIGRQKVDKLRSRAIAVGKMEQSTQEFRIGDVPIPVYDCMEEQYALISDLRQLGCNVRWDPNTKITTIYDFNQPTREEIQFDKLNEGALAYLGRGTTYINYQEIPSVFVEGKTLIPIKWLSVFFNDEFGLLTLRKIEDVSINIINIWSEGERYIEEPYGFEKFTAAEEVYYRDLKHDLNPEYTYVGYVIADINGQVNGDIDLHRLWLQNPTTFQEPTPVLVPESAPELEPELISNPESLGELFPKNTIMATMKYAAKGLAKGEVLEVKKAQSGSSYYLVNKSGQTVVVPWGSVTIKGVPVNKIEATKEQIEQYANEKNLVSKTNYLVWTDLYRQRTYILTGSKNNWKLHKSILSSSGRDITPTPKGQYTLNRRVPYFGKGYMAKNAFAFIGGEYLYHSVLFDAGGRYLLEGRGILGQKASQGCIRFSPEDSEWFYKTMPLGTTVFIN